VALPHAYKLHVAPQHILHIICVLAHIICAYIIQYVMAAYKCLIRYVHRMMQNRSHTTVVIEAMETCNYNLGVPCVACDNREGGAAGYTDIPPPLVPNVSPWGV